MIAQAQIEAAKAVNLVELLKSKGLPVKKQGNQYLVCCPFHNDHHPSLAIDLQTNLFKCFGCGVSGDAIRFIELYEKKDFRQAVQSLTADFTETASPATSGDPPPAQKLLQRAVALYHETFLTTAAPQEYLAGRGITNPELYRRFQLGYANGLLLRTIAAKSPLTATLKSLGLLTKSGEEFFSGCLTVPLLDVNGNAVGVYGRKINPQSRTRHLYLPGARRGLVNRQAAFGSEQLVLTEAIIDALTLCQNGFSNVIPLYGASGFTTEHLELLAQTRPQKIYLCLDQDEAGAKAAHRIGQTLKENGFNVTKIELPVKDVNDFFLSGKGKEDFTRLLSDQEPLAPAEHGFILTRDKRQYRVQGFSHYSLERLRVNIRGALGEQYHIDTFDLYQSRARKTFAGHLGKLFALEPEVIETDLLRIITEAEAYQNQLLAAENQPKKAEILLSKEEEAQALQFLQTPKLMEEIVADLEALGHVGEEGRKLLTYLIAVSRKLERPLSGIIISGSGAGKSGLVEKIQELTPPEDVEFFSRITPQALYYMERSALKRKLLIIEERTGGEGADYSIRTLQSRQKLTQAVPIKDPNSGKIRTMTFEVEGPIAYLETTTNAELNHENATRCFEIYLDESSEQTRRIHQAQREAKTVAGIEKKQSLAAIKERHHNAQRLLKTIPVTNPYAPFLDFPVDALRTRRDHERFLSLIEAITFLHQYQRPKRQLDDGQGGKLLAVESTLKDYEYAYQLAQEILGFTLDDLRKHARDLLNQIKELVRQKSEAQGKPGTAIAFTRREIREFTGWPDYQLKTYIRQLEDLEYLLIQQVKARGQYEYRLNDPQERRPLKGLLTPEELEKILADSIG